jgi:hypothetical protein
MVGAGGSAVGPARHDLIMDKPIPDGRYPRITFDAPTPKLPADAPPPELQFDHGHLTASSAHDLTEWALESAGRTCSWCHAPTTTTTLDAATFRSDDPAEWVVAACPRCKTAHAA